MTGWSSPVLVKQRLYLTGSRAKSGSSGLELAVLCLDARSGAILWSTNVFTPDNGANIHRKNGYASPTPVVRDGRLYAHFGHLGTACLDLKGQVIWRQTSVQYPPVHGNGGSPVLAGDHLIFSCDGASDPFVIALDRKTGEVRWKTRRPNDALAKKFSFSTPLLITHAGRQELISPGAGGTYAYDPLSGRLLWQVSTGTGFSVVPRPVFAHGLLFVNTDYDFPKLYAIRPGGDGDVTTTHLAWQTGRGAPSTPRPWSWEMSFILSPMPVLRRVPMRGVARCIGMNGLVGILSVAGVRRRPDLFSERGRRRIRGAGGQDLSAAGAQRIG